MKMSFNIIATMEHDSWRSGDKGRRCVRRYKALDNALTRTDSWLREEGRVKSKVVIHHALTGLEIGVLKLTAKGQIVKNWIFEE